MSGTAGAAEGSRKDRPKNTFKPGNPGKPKGALDRRTIVSMEVSRSLAGQAINRVEQLIHSRSSRIAFEASRLVLAYAWGAPRQTLELTGGVGDLSRELAAMIEQVRARRAALEGGAASGPARPALPAPPADLHSGGNLPYPTAAEGVVDPASVSGPDPARNGTESSS